MNNLLELLERKRQGLDHTEEESWEVLDWLRQFRTVEDQPLESEIQLLFPEEYGEYAND